MRAVTAQALGEPKAGFPRGARRRAAGTHLLVAQGKATAERPTVPGDGAPLDRRSAAASQESLRCRAAVAAVAAPATATPAAAGRTKDVEPSPGVPGGTAAGALAAGAAVAGSAMPADTGGSVGTPCQPAAPLPPDGAAINDSVGGWVASPRAEKPGGGAPPPGPSTSREVSRVSRGPSGASSLASPEPTPAFRVFLRRRMRKAARRATSTAAATPAAIPAIMPVLLLPEGVGAPAVVVPAGAPPPGLCITAADPAVDPAAAEASAGDTDCAGVHL